MHMCGLEVEISSCATCAVAMSRSLGARPLGRHKDEVGCAQRQCGHVATCRLSSSLVAPVCFCLWYVEALGSSRTSGSESCSTPLLSGSF